MEQVTDSGFYWTSQLNSIARRNQRFGLPWNNMEILSAGWQCFVLLSIPPLVSKVELSAWLLETSSIFSNGFQMKSSSHLCSPSIAILDSGNRDSNVRYLCIIPQQILRNYSLTHCAFVARLGGEFFHLVNLVRNKGIAARKRSILGNVCLTATTVAPVA